MMKRLIIASLFLAVTACSSDSVQQVPSDFLCHNVEKSKVIPGATGFLPVERISTEYGIEIGFYHDGRFSKHSACSAAMINSSSTEFRWYQFGQPSTVGNVHSIEFYTNAFGELASKAVSTLDSKGHWTEQVVEGDRVTKQVWLSETFESVIAHNQFNGDASLKVTVENGELKKVKEFDRNTALFNCTYTSQNGQLTVDDGCLNESQLDLLIFNTPVNSDFYLETIQKSSIDYETNPENLMEDVQRFFG